MAISQLIMSISTMKMSIFSVAVVHENPLSTSSSAVLQRDACRDLKDLPLKQSPTY
jgi:hypothetical protein